MEEEGKASKPTPRAPLSCRIKEKSKVNKGIILHSASGVKPTKRNKSGGKSHVLGREKEKVGRVWGFRKGGKTEIQAFFGS